MAITTTAAIIMGAMAVAAAGTTAYTSANERASAREATAAQRDIANNQIAAGKEKETLAKDTATAKLKAARAKKSNTILTSPMGVEDDDTNVNTAGAIGV